MVIGIVQLIKGLSNQLYKKAKKVVGNKINTVKQDILTKKTKAATDADILPSSEIILKEEEAIGLNERMAQEISKNGIECKAITDIGSLEIERRTSCPTINDRIFSYHITRIYLIPIQNLSKKPEGLPISSAEG